MYDAVHGGLGELIFIDANIDAPTPEGDMPGECRVRKVSCANMVEKAKRKRLERKEDQKKALAEKWKEVDPYLGTMPDPDIGRKFKIATSTITSRRLRKKIPAYVPPSRVPWDEIIPRLGKEPDTALAKEFGVYSGTLRRKRQFLEIAAYDLQKFGKGRKPGRSGPPSK